MKNWKNILIIILLLVIIIEPFIFNNRKNSNKVTEQIVLKEKYGYDNIKYNGNIKLESKFCMNGRLLLLTLNSNKDLNGGKVTVLFKDSNESNVKTEIQEFSYIKQNDDYLLFIPVPELNSKYAGDIDIDIEVKELTDDVILLDKKTLNLDSNINNDNITIDGINPFSEQINYLMGVILFYNGDELVYFTNFGDEKIKSGEKINININNLDLSNIKYDRTELIIEYLF